MRNASPAQIGRIERTLTDNNLHGDQWDRLWARLEAHRIDERTPGDGAPIRMSNASEIIDWLTGQGYQPKSRAAAQGGQLAELGVYRKDSRIFVVREFKPQGEDRKVRYAREIVEIAAGRDDRISADGEKARYEEAKAPRMQWELTEADLLPMADFRALCQHYAQCIACGRTLTAAKSIEAAIGPVCGARQDRAGKEGRTLAQATA